MRVGRQARSVHDGESRRYRLPFRHDDPPAIHGRDINAHVKLRSRAWLNRGPKAFYCCRKHVQLKQSQQSKSAERGQPRAATPLGCQRKYCWHPVNSGGVAQLLRFQLSPRT